MKNGFKLEEDIKISLTNLSHSEKKQKLNRLKEIEDELEKLYSQKKNELSKTKGDLLEEYISLILEFNNCLIDFQRNIQTATNEIDFHISLTKNAKLYRYKKIIPEFIPDHFIFECKNYKKSLDIPLINKFHSVLITQNYNFGILFSYSGITGEKIKAWKDGLGFIKKINLLAVNVRDISCQNCNLKNRFPILFYSNKLKTHELITKYNCDLFEWIDKSMEEMKLDCKIT